jgi:hypothetical protein
MILTTSTDAKVIVTHYLLADWAKRSATGTYQLHDSSHCPVGLCGI